MILLIYYQLLASISTQHWRVLFISRSTTQTLSSIFPSGGLSDHMLVIADLKVNIQKKYLQQKITYRNTKSIALDKFKLDIQKADLITDPKHSAAELYNQFHKTLESLLVMFLLKPKLSRKSHKFSGGQTKLILRNASAVNLIQSGREPVFRLTGRNILNNYICVID